MERTLKRSLKKAAGKQRTVNRHQQVLQLLDNHNHSCSLIYPTYSFLASWGECTNVLKSLSVNFKENERGIQYVTNIINTLVNFAFGKEKKVLLL